MAQNLIVSTYAFYIIYVYSIDDANHLGILKVGKATLYTAPKPFDQLPPNCDLLMEAAKARIDQQTTTAGIPYHIEYVELAHIINEEGLDVHFDDTAVHQVLLNSGYTRHVFPGLESTPQEWFDISDVDIVKRAIAAVKDGRNCIDGPASEKKNIVIKFREEQEAAIRQTTGFFAHKGKMLWNAKMRFGKTLCALEVVRQCAFRKTLILTHRPAVKGGWFEDFHLIKFEGYQYGSKPGNGKNGQPQVGESFDVLAKSGAPFIYFASMQDLRGSWDKTSDKLKKNQDVFATQWDLVIIDEAHEGTTTPLGKMVVHQLEKRCKRFLYLSGTPYNILGQFKPEEIYTWDYIQEQEAKEQWPLHHPDEKNPYEGLAHLNIRTYNLGRVFENYNHSDEDYFDFSEFFRTLTGNEAADGRPLAGGESVGDFAHAKDVRSFLDLLCKPSEESYYPFSREEYKAYFAHTFWVLPGVNAAKALSSMLQAHPFFSQFHVVNVAGEGDKMEAEGDADDSSKTDKLEKDCVAKVKAAIATHERTITLSCGRMTTGVSIEQWTAVFMLAGAYTTRAAGYLQTIFRAQTPFKRTLGIKTECYAFDFAPDRTLTVIDEFIRNTQPKGGSGKGGKRITAESFLRFCSVIAIDGARTIDYDARKFMTQVNRAYAEHIVGKGFRDDRLYTGISTVGETDLGWIKEIAAVLKGKGGKSKSKDDGKVKVTDEGMTSENGSKSATTSGNTNTGNPPSVKKKKAKLSPDDQARALLKDVLNVISVRMPMMIYGVVEEDENITLQEFIADIDQDSWEEFMPKGFEKKHFSKIGKFYNNDAFIASVADILGRSKATDSLSVKERVEEVTQLISTFHYPDKETVLTPWRVVNMHMTATLGGYDFYDEQHQTLLAEPRFVRQEGVTDKVLAPTDTRILEINSKSGVYPLWLAYTLFRMQGEGNMFGAPQTAEEEKALWRQVVERNIFIVCKTKMAEKITRRVLVGYDTSISPNTMCIKALVETLRQSKDYAPLVSKISNPKTYGNNNMKDKKLKFNAVVGNPPYQIVNKGDGNGADPIYHLFLDFAQEACSRGTLIHPARFLFNAGKTPKDWNQRFLNDPHVKVVDYWASSMDVFPTVDVKGGIAVTYWDKDKDFGTIGFFSVFEELRTILHKVQSFNEESFSTIVAPRELYSITDELYKEHPEMEGRQSKGHKYSLGANIFDVFPELFTDDASDAETKGKAKIYGRYENQRCYKWIKDTYITHPDNYDKYKVVIPKSNGSGAIGEVLSTPIVGEPIVGYTDTFLGVGCFDSQSETEACLKYIKTKFARTMLGTLKVTQDNPSSTWANVPLQDFTASSDIDWSASISAIDRQLYAKYGLTDDEVAFIEKMIKPMD